MGAILDIRHLSVSFKGDQRFLFTRSAPVNVLSDLSLTVDEGETVGIVGESGSGKTTLLLSLLHLIPATGGEVLFGGEDVLSASGKRLRRLRREIQVVFQNPFSSLDPRMSALELVSEPLRVHLRRSAAERRARVEELLDAVGIPNRLLGAYPHELSGGQAQRVALARALALSPRMLLFDEPTSSLDVSVQAQVLNLLMDLRERFGLTYLFVSHDLGVVRHLSDRIVVMYLGEIIEDGRAGQVFEHPEHPYTRALLAANALSGDPEGRLVLQGSVPSFADPPPGCRFHPRCPFAFEPCPVLPPGETTVAVGHVVRCHLVEQAVGQKPTA